MSDTVQANAVIKLEPLSNALWDELEPLLHDHWDEVETERDFPPDPDRDLFAKIEAVGMLKVYTARVDERLVGYIAFFLSNSLHSRGVLVAKDDAMFVHKDYRTRRLGSDMVMFAVQHLRSLGARMVYITSKHRAGANIGPLLWRLGFMHDEDVYAMRLDQE